MPTRKARGSRTQALVARWYQRLWPAATTQGAGAAGRDVLNVPLSIEVKGRRAFAPLEWIRQARRAARPEEDEFPPHVVMRPDGVGETNVGDFLVIRRLADDTEILRELLEMRAKEPGRWWKVVGSDGELWCETSDEREAREAMRPGDELFRLWTRHLSEWRPACGQEAGDA